MEHRCSVSSLDMISYPLLPFRRRFQSSRPLSVWHELFFQEWKRLPWISHPKAAQGPSLGPRAQLPLDPVWVNASMVLRPGRRPGRKCATWAKSRCSDVSPLPLASTLRKYSFPLFFKLPLGMLKMEDFIQAYLNLLLPANPDLLTCSQYPLVISLSGRFLQVPTFSLDKICQNQGGRPMFIYTRVKETLGSLSSPQMFIG